MGLDVPRLDDRSYEDLVEEARKLIPAYSEEWTNYNPSDPGIAILELLAWLTETYTYQLDAVTDEHRQKYLKLVGEAPRPPTTASVELALQVPDGAAGVTIPEGERLLAIEGPDTERIFETDHDVVLTDASVRTILSENGDTFTDYSHANDTGGMFYRPFGDRPTSGDAMYLGFDGDPFAGARTLSLTVDFHESDLPSPASHGEEPVGFEPSVYLAWEYCRDYESLDEDASWEPISVVRDGTNRFYRGGTVTLRRPDGWTPEEWAIADAGVNGQAGRHWIRCRLLDSGYEIPPQFDAVEMNVVLASNRATIRDERLDRDRTGRRAVNLTEQRYHFDNDPVLSASITVDGVRWREVEDFDASGPSDAHYVLERTAGVVRFGDGVRGKLPPPTATVVAEEYVYGGGEDGNVPESTAWRFADADAVVGEAARLSDVAVESRGPARGGKDAERIDSAFERVKRDRRTPFRAVTEDDFEYVATHTPGLRFGRATVLVEDANVDGYRDGPPAVTVVVVPYVPPDLSRPTPSEGFLEAVQTHLDEHRLLTDRVSVSAPQYVGIEVSVTVQSTLWYPSPSAEAEIESAISGYLDPIHGFEGDGWPFGRKLYRNELVAVLEAVEWVESVRSLSIHARGNATVDAEDNVTIGDDALFYLSDLTTDVLRSQNSGAGSTGGR